MESQKRRPTFGPKQGSPVWKSKLKRDVKLKNLEKARSARKENAEARIQEKEQNATN